MKRACSWIAIAFAVIMAASACGPRRLPPGVDGVASVSKRALERTLRSYLGAPYRNGGVTRTGVDCSGLVMRAFREHGINLPRTARAQSRVGFSVSRSGLRFGDLVFFRTNGSKRGHVGVYLGDEEFIHASSRRGVIVSRLDDHWYSDHFVVARRVITHLSR